jgi:hypothetical protein
MRGCDKNAPIPVMDIDGERIYRCPFKLVTNQSISYVQFWNYYRSGYLPNEGPISLQPHKFLCAVGELNALKNEENDKSERR